ncbi:glycosyltransferase family 1 protein, partial [Candidatus Peregrinibacteria bacterium]|nr:glycosyltransferase family 1 protein [Candidatus Peregrinibacteria bacterium]
MNLLMISGDRTLASGKQGAFYATLEELRKHWERIDVICPQAKIRSTKSEARNNSKNSKFEGRKQFRSFRASSVECISDFGSRISDFPNVFLHPSPHGLWYQPLWILRKGKELSRQRRYTVMTVHEYPPFYNGFGAWLLHWATGIPYVSEIHHVVGHPAAANVQEWIGRRLYPLYLRTIGRTAAAFRVVNAGTRELLVQWGIRKEKVHIIPSFYLDHHALSSVLPLEKKWDVVFCGRMVPNKGVPRLLRALAHIPDAKLLLMGDGPKRFAYYGMAKKLGVRFDPVDSGVLWQVDPFAVYQLMQRTKVLVMCSLSEGGPRVVLEAMALGLPVIATNVGIVPDIIRDGENGLITNGTPQDLAEKIQKLLSDDALRARLGLCARDVLQVFERRKLIR